MGSESMSISLSALQSSQSWLDRIANNISNSSTPGYAEQTGSFADTYTQALGASATAPAAAPRYTPPGWWGGTGVMSAGIENNFTQLPIQPTGTPTDLAIQGDAFFAVRGNNGQVMLTKAGNFQWSQLTNGKVALTTPDGLPVLDTHGQPILQPSADASQFSVGPNGLVSLGPTGSASTAQSAATAQRIALVRVAEPSVDVALAGNNLYALQQGAKLTIVNSGVTTSSNAGSAQGTGAGSSGAVGAGAAGAGNGAGAAVNAASPGSSDTSSIMQGALAMSNVDMTQAMTDLIQAQRMFDLNSEALQLNNQMSQTAVAIKP